MIEDDYTELISVIKRRRLPSPPKRAHIESVPAPAWLRESLKSVGYELPAEMYLIDCSLWISFKPL